LQEERVCVVSIAVLQIAMRPTAHRIVPIAAMVKVIVRDTHISDKIANSQRIVPHIKEAIIKPTELLLFRLALGVFFFSLIKPSLLFGCTKTPPTMSFKVDIRSTINEYIPCGIYINAEYSFSPQIRPQVCSFHCGLHLLRGSSGISRAASLCRSCALRMLMARELRYIYHNTP
jgi:hypothetical protein